MVRVKVGTAAIVILIILAVAYILVPRAPPVPKGGVLVIVQSQDADILDIHRTVFDPATRVIGLICDTLMTFDWGHAPAGEILGGCP
ncbi:MAG: hypothetical protein QMC89_03560 [Candidatus Hodarchaeaceae archaeon]|nr:hypothetical protein [Candidatus Hodarchaeaceae archaeon]